MQQNNRGACQACLKIEPESRARLFLGVTLKEAQPDALLCRRKYFRLIFLLPCLAPDAEMKHLCTVWSGSRAEPQPFEAPLAVVRAPRPPVCKVFGAGAVGFP